MRIVERQVPKDHVATKYLQATSDGFVVETTYIDQPRKHILCVSTQVGCPVGCTFCVSGLRSQESKYLRNLTAREIVDQCWNVAREMDFSSGKPLLFSFMGEGEPFLNFEACTDAFLHLVMIGWPVPIRLAVSTSGIRPDLITELGNLKFLVPLKLQISLHGPTDEVRRKIVPHTSPLADILAAVRSYPLTDGRTVEWNYVPCAGVNDAPEHAHALVELLGPGWHVKFNHLNLAVNSPFQPSPAENVSRFRDILHAGGITTECYFTDESSISSGCGQLSYSRVEALALR